MFRNLMFAFILLLGHCVVAQDPQYPVMSCDAAKRLPQEEARNEPNVRLNGVVTSVPKGWKGFFVADSTGGVYCEPLDAEAEASFWPVIVGESLELEGIIVEGAFNSYVLVQRVVKRSDGEFPKPQPKRLADLDPIKDDANLIRVRGFTVRTISIAGEMEYGLVADGVEVDVAHSGFRLDSKIPNHTEVEVCGVGIPIDGRVPFKITVPTSDCFRVLRSRAKVYADTPLESIESILSSRGSSSRMVRFSGEVFRSQESRAWLFDNGFGLEWEGDIESELAESQYAEFAGILNHDGDRYWVKFGEAVRSVTSQNPSWRAPIVKSFEKQRDLNRIVTREGVLVDRHTNDGTTFLIFENAAGRWSAIPPRFSGVNSHQTLMFGATYGVTGLVITTTDNWQDHVQMIKGDDQILYIAAPPLSPTHKLAFLLTLSAVLTLGLCVLTIYYRQIVRAKEHLEGVRNELREANESLESKIASRTYELQSLNRALIIAERKANEANLAKSAFLANMSHEIRTPMTAILGFTELLDDEEDLSPEEKQSFLATIKENGAHLLSVIDEILDLSQIEAGKMALSHERVCLKQIVQDVMTLLSVRARSKGLEFRFDALADVPEFIWTDPKRIRQILLNLVGNAIKFTEKGSVIVEIKRFNDVPQASVCIEIVDTGIGIRMEHVSRLFHAFEQFDNSSTRAHGGTGLGLNISMNLAKMLGGDIQVESTLGRGSRF